MIKIRQYNDKITIDGSTKNAFIEIRYSGSFVGEVAISSVHVAMNKNTIYLTDIKDDLSDEVFMRYYGNLKITSVYSHQKWEDTKIIAKIPEDFSRYSDKINRMATKFDSSDIVYDKFGEPDRYKGNVKSLLSYRNNDKQYYLSKNKRSGFLPKSYMVKEKKILKTLKQGVE